MFYIKFIYNNTNQFLPLLILNYFWEYQSEFRTINSYIPDYQMDRLKNDLKSYSMSFINRCPEEGCIINSFRKKNSDSKSVYNILNFFKINLNYLNFRKSPSKNLVGFKNSTELYNITLNLLSRGEKDNNNNLEFLKEVIKNTTEIYSETYRDSIIIQINKYKYAYIYIKSTRKSKEYSISKDNSENKIYIALYEKISEKNKIVVNKYICKS